MLAFTERAAAKVRDLMRAEGGPVLALRVSVTGGGCAGHQYAMAFTHEAGAGDMVLQEDGFQVFVDPQSARMLQGAVVDYVETLMGAGFKIENPNARATCGCGNSFALDEAQAEADPALMERVSSALASIRPFLRAEGGDVELAGISGGTVRVRLAGACAGCSAATVTLRMVIERRLRELVPEVEQVVAI